MTGRPTASRFAEHPCGGAAWPAKASIAPNSTPGWPGSVEDPGATAKRPVGKRRGLHRVVGRAGAWIWAESDRLDLQPMGNCTAQGIRYWGMPLCRFHDLAEFLGSRVGRRNRDA